MSISRLRLVVDHGVVLERPARPAGGEVELKLGECILGTFKRRGRWRAGTLFVRRRLAELERLIDVRHGGPCDTDDGELYFDVALPHLVALPEADFPASPALLWAWSLCPRLVDTRGREWITEREAELRTRRRPIRLKADTIAERLGVRDEERSRLKLWTIGAIDRPAEQRKADAKVANRDRMRRKRAQDKVERAALDQALRQPSISSLKPWAAEGISRSSWYAKRQREASSASVGQPACGLQSVATNFARDAVQHGASVPMTSAPLEGAPRPARGNRAA